MPSHPASTLALGASLHHFVGYLARMRFFTLSVILHGIVLAFVAGMFWYTPVPPQSDYLAHKGVGFELPGPVPPEVVPEDELTPPEASLSSSGSIRGPKNWGVPQPATPPLESTTAPKVLFGAHVLVQTPSGPTCIWRPPVGPQNVVVVMDGLQRRNGETTVSKEHAALERAAIDRIQGMSEKDRLGVVVFARSARVLSERCETPTGAQKNRAIAWLNGSGPKAANSPPPESATSEVREALGLMAAFALSPTEIYFYCDAPLTEQAALICRYAVERCEGRWPARVPINTVTSGNRADHAFLKDLASRTGGTFQVVEPDSGK